MNTPEGTTHMLYITDFMGHWEFWKEEQDSWFYFDLFSFEWQEASPDPRAMPKPVEDW